VKFTWPNKFNDNLKKEKRKYIYIYIYIEEGCIGRNIPKEGESTKKIKKNDKNIISAQPKDTLG
jgi:hypothetical protein